MIECACTCEEGCGVAHSHVQERVRLRRVGREDKPFTLSRRDYELNRSDPDYELLDTTPESIRIWVDWKAVAKALSS